MLSREGTVEERLEDDEGLVEVPNNDHLLWSGLFVELDPLDGDISKLCRFRERERRRYEKRKRNNGARWGKMKEASLKW